MLIWAIYNGLFSYPRFLGRKARFQSNAPTLILKIAKNTNFPLIFFKKTQKLQISSQKVTIFPLTHFNPCAFD
jgi:hypothetical protein